MIIGFWKRLVSDLIDLIFIYCFGWILSAMFRTQFFTLGENGFWLGIVVTFLYFGILQSSVGRGQTLANKILKIQVLKTDGNYLNLGQSFSRSFLLILIVYKTVIRSSIFLIFPYSVEIGVIYTGFSYILILGYFLVMPIHSLKKGFHDLAVGSIVVKNNSYDPKILENSKNNSRDSISYITWIVSALVVIVVIAIDIFIYEKGYGTAGEIRDQVNIQKDLISSSGLVNARSWHKTVKTDNGEKLKLIIVDGFILKPKFEEVSFREQEIQKALQIVLSTCVLLKDYDRIRIFVRTGYNIGISKVDVFYREDFTTDGKKIDEESGSGKGKGE